MLPIHKRERRSLHLSGAMANLIYVVAFSWGRLGTHCKMSKYFTFLDVVASLTPTGRPLYVCWLDGQLVILFTQHASYVIWFSFFVSRKWCILLSKVSGWNLVMVVGWGGGWWISAVLQESISCSENIGGYNLFWIVGRIRRIAATSSCRQD